MKKQTTAYKAGFEVGFKKGRERVCGILIQRTPPDTYETRDWCDWSRGYKDGLRARKYHKFTFVTVETTPIRFNGVKRYSGWPSDKRRGKILSMIEREYDQKGGVEVESVIFEQYKKDINGSELLIKKEAWGI